MRGVGTAAHTAIPTDGGTVAGGPGGKDSKVPAGADPTQGTQAAAGVEQLPKGSGGKGRHGKHEGKPGWGNGGSGPPGLMKKRGGGGGGGGGGGDHCAQMSRPMGTMAAPTQNRPAAPGTTAANTEAERERARVAAANGTGGPGAATTPGGRNLDDLRSGVQLDAVGGTARPLETQAGPARPNDESLRRSVQLGAVDGLQAQLTVQPAPVAPQDDSLRAGVQLPAVGDSGADYGIEPARPSIA